VEQKGAKFLDGWNEKAKESRLVRIIRKKMKCHVEKETSLQEAASRWMELTN